MKAIFTTVVNTRWQLLADLMCYQHLISMTRENNCNLSITGGHQYVVEEVCGVGVVVSAF
jgi:hypothetical protein